MPSIDWKSMPSQVRQKAAGVPRWIWAVAAVGILTVGMLGLLLSGGPAYTPLFDGLSAHRGGEVISKLQKLGIPYRLSANGSVISVPQPDLGRARLELGQAGLPGDSGSEAWTKLTDGSLTSSASSVDALRKRALEVSLQNAIAGIRGIASDRVTLALPRSTPFLGDQPHPKGSVWLQTEASGISSSQARAIAQLVANAVPGLRASRVTVTDQNGDLLAPVGQVEGQARQQLAFQDQIEAEAASHIQALLDPVIGSSNFRVSVAADVDFSKTQQQQVSYGPKRQADQLQQEMESRNGNQKMPMIPGALSNQPPGKAAAPLKKPSKKNKKQSSPKHRSNNDRWNIHYDVDHQTSVITKPNWALRALSVSVVINKSTLGKSKLAAQVKSIVSHAISAPQLSVSVASVPFGMAQVSAPAWKQVIGNPSLIRALMELLAALALLLGVARPMARWLAAKAPSIMAKPAFQLATAGGAPDAGTAENDRMAQDLQRARDAASVNPDEVAELLKGWLKDPSGPIPAAPRSDDPPTEGEGT